MMGAPFKYIVLSFLLIAGAAQAEGEATSVLSTTGTSTKSVPVIKNEPTRDLISSDRNVYKFSFFSMLGGRTVDADRGGSSIGAYNYIGLSKKIDSEDQIAFRYVFYYDSAGYKFNSSKYKEEYVGHRTEMGDPYFSYSRYSIAKLSDWNFSGGARVYLPFSRSSQATKMVTQLRSELFLDRPLMKFSNLNFGNKIDYYVQTQKAYLDGEVARREDGTYPSNAVKGTKQWNTENYIEIDANLSRKVSFKPRVAFEDSWYYGSEIENIAPRHDTDFKTQVGFDYRAAKSLSFSVAMENRTALLNRKEPVAYGRPEDNRWTFATYASY